MSYSLSDRVFRRAMNRRDFLWLMSASGVAASATLAGCAVDPVTGKQTFVLMSEEQEVALDQQQAPYQFSNDYGELQDTQVNGYVSDLGHELARLSHRPQMPYTFRGVNSTAINAYAFPGGTIAVTRGILVEMDNEAELAALLGHEIGHVNARHQAEQAAKTKVAELAMAGANAYVRQSEHSDYAGLFEALGSAAKGALLAHYSRDDEREADELGMTYMTRAGQNPNGMAGLMNILRQSSRHKPGMLDLMFATHPMSDERYQTAKSRARQQYGSMQKAPDNRERYMDSTARVRRIKGAIEAIQRAEADMNQSKLRSAEGHLKQALRVAPRDYTALVMMAKCQLAQENPRAAQRYAERAKRIYPSEAQGHHTGGLAKLMQRQFDGAYQDFSQYDAMLPGNPNTTFLKGVSLEGMQNVPGAAQEYYSFLQSNSQGWQAQHAYQRLASWGYVR